LDRTSFLWFLTLAVADLFFISMLQYSVNYRCQCFNHQWFRRQTLEAKLEV
jgi:hypothetical protein